MVRPWSPAPCSEEKIVAFHPLIARAYQHAHRRGRKPQVGDPVFGDDSPQPVGRGVVRHALIKQARMAAEVRAHEFIRRHDPPEVRDPEDRVAVSHVEAILEFATRAAHEARVGVDGGPWAFRWCPRCT